jgi:hypothetical protein
MTWPRIAVYYALGVLLGGYFLLFEWRPDSEKPLPSRPLVPQSRFLPIPRDGIHELALRRDEAAVTCLRDGQGWTVVDPPNARVTSALIASFVESLTVEKEVQVVEESPKDLSPYGLAHPYSTVVLKGEGKDTLATVFIGDRNPTSSAVYVRKENSPQVVLLGASVRYYEELIFEAAGASKK